MYCCEMLYRLNCQCSGLVDGVVNSLLRSHAIVHLLLQAALSKLLTYCAFKSSQPPTLRSSLDENSSLHRASFYLQQSIFLYLLFEVTVLEYVDFHTKANLLSQVTNATVIYSVVSRFVTESSFIQITIVHIFAKLSLKNVCCLNGLLPKCLFTKFFEGPV